MPYHSIIIAAHNRFSYLQQTIESCLSSSAPDLEILIVDDASDVKTADRFYDYVISLDPRIRIVRESQNMGIGERLRQLNLMATGQLVHLIGSDDLSHPHRLAIARSVLNDKPYNTVMCTRAKQADSKYRVLSNTNYYEPNFIKAGLFFQPFVLHPSVSTWNIQLSNLKPYRSRMRAAVDYCNYVDNYFTSRFISFDAKLVYLVHSSSGITRNPVSRCNQLAMHDFVMHRLWNYFGSFALSDISLIRTLVVTSEYPQISLESVDKNKILHLLDLLHVVQTKIFQLANDSPSGNHLLSFLTSQNDKTAYLFAIQNIFCSAAEHLRSRIQH